MDSAIWAQMGAALSMGLGAIGAAVGEGRTAAAAAAATARQPGATQEILKTMLVGQAVAESASIFALVVALLLLFTPWSTDTLTGGIALLSAGLCMGAGALGPGLGAGFSAAAACTGTGRLPRASARITTTMLVGQAVAQTPSVFALLVAFLLLFREPPAGPALLPVCASLLGAGLATGVGAIGPGIGAGFVGASACRATSRRPALAPQLLRIMLTGQAVSQSTSVYALVVSFLLLFAT